MAFFFVMDRWLIIILLPFGRIRWARSGIVSQSSLESVLQSITKHIFNLTTQFLIGLSRLANCSLTGALSQHDRIMQHTQTHTHRPIDFCMRIDQNSWSIRLFNEKENSTASHRRSIRKNVVPFFVWMFCLRAQFDNKIRGTMIGQMKRWEKVHHSIQISSSNEAVTFV